MSTIEFHNVKLIVFSKVKAEQMELVDVCNREELKTIIELEITVLRRIQQALK